MASEASSQRFDVPVSKLKNGLYLLKVTSDHEMYSAPVSVFTR